MYQKSDQHLQNLEKARKKAVATKKECPHCTDLISSCGFKKHIKYCSLNPKNLIKQKCPHCTIALFSSGFKNHVKNCLRNPVNIILCAVCDKPVNTKNAKTCSRACSNKFFKRRYKATNYRTICFRHYEKKCAVCDERRIVAVHHMDEDHSNDDPSNLVPLCPTHHQYVHSRHKHLIIDEINKYLKNRTVILNLH